MELSFQTLQLRSWCEDPESARLSLNPKVADQLKDRIADLRAATSPMELIAGSPRFIEGKNPRVILQIGASHELTCGVNHAKPRLTDDLQTDWLHVQRLKIISLKEVHG
jgi:hypothetical protein